MSRVYQVNGIEDAAYFNTAREAYRHKPGGEVAQSVECHDAAIECGRLTEVSQRYERDYLHVRMLLDELCGICPDDVLSTRAGRMAAEFVAAHPMPAATAACRDGQRSYGGG